LSNEEIRRCVTMVTETYFDERLNKALGEYGEMGFRLQKAGFNIVDLYLKDKKLATYNTDATIDVIREHIKNYIINMLT